MNSYLHGTDALVATRDPLVHRDVLSGLAELLDRPDDDEMAKRRAAVQFLDAHRGLPYLWGGKNPKIGLDCSGAVTQAWEAANIIPRGKGSAFTAQALYNATDRVPLSEALPGDLAFYGNWNHIHHTMMVVGDGRVIGAIGSGIPLKYEPTLRYNAKFYSVGRAPIKRPLGRADGSSRWWPVPVSLLFLYAVYRNLPERFLVGN